MPAIVRFYIGQRLAQYFNIVRQTRTRISPVTSVAGFFIFNNKYFTSISLHSQRRWRPCNITINVTAYCTIHFTQNLCWQRTLHWYYILRILLAIEALIKNKGPLFRCRRRE